MGSLTRFVPHMSTSPCIDDRVWHAWWLPASSLFDRQGPLRVRCTPCTKGDDGESIEQVVRFLALVDMFPSLRLRSLCNISAMEGEDLCRGDRLASAICSTCSPPVRILVNVLHRLVIADFVDLGPAGSAPGRVHRRRGAGQR